MSRILCSSGIALGAGLMRRESYLNVFKGTRCAFSSQRQTEEFTHIIVGAGSAGCVIANRLSAHPSNKVLLLEAGRSDKTWRIQMPAALLHHMGRKEYNWYYNTTPQKHLDNRELFWPRGKALGGTTSINGMVYTRAHAYDYDRWEREGAEGWSYADCLPYFKRAQNHEYGENEYRGGDGPLHTIHGEATNPLSQALLNAAVKCGYPRSSDMNGYQQEGFGTLDSAIHNGIRWNTANAYLRADGVEQRENSSSLAEKILFEGTKAVGVDYTQKRKMKTARATKEIVLCGGTVNSPHLLMLSGVGNADDLKKHDISIVAHLPGVGKNLVDHARVDLQYACKQPVTMYSATLPHNMVKIGLQWFLYKGGAGSISAVEVAGFIRSSPGVEHPDITMLLFPALIYDHGRKQGKFKFHGFQLMTGILRPTSSGSVTLKSRDPKQDPFIDPNYLATETDVSKMRDSINHVRELVHQSPFDNLRGKEISPGPSFQTDKELNAFLRAKTEAMYHPSSSCKMGSEYDEMAVVDSQTRVIGTENLRVVDASIMPSNVSGYLMAPVIMMAEKASDIILGKEPLEKTVVPVWKPATIETQRCVEAYRAVI